MNGSRGAASLVVCLGFGALAGVAGDGLALTVGQPGGSQAVQCSQLSVRPEMALQSTLFSLTEATARALLQRRIDPAAVERSRQFRDEHRRMHEDVRRLGRVADRLDELPPADARVELDRVHAFLVRELLPHNREEDTTVYPVVADLIGGQDPTATMNRAHQEIAFQ